jgi:hypothetical protein
MDIEENNEKYESAEYTKIKFESENIIAMLKSLQSKKIINKNNYLGFLDF